MPEPIVIGIDLGGTKISAAAVDGAGAVLHRIKQPVQKNSFEDTSRQIPELVRQVILESAINPDDLTGIGICVPGIYFAQTGNAWAPNLWGWDKVPLWDALHKRLPAPLFIDSDRAAYVLGEQWLGAARGLTDVIFLAVGTGIGAGIITGGRLCRGASDIAGAVGWFALDPATEDGHRRELFKRVGCLEAMSAGPAVARRATERIAAGERSLIAGLAGSNPVTAEIVVEAARRDDPLALSILDETSAWLAMGVANLISVLNPEMIVLGGGLMQASGFILEPLRRRVIEWAQPLAASQVSIELTQLGEDAGLLGAARLPLLSGNL